MSDIIFYECGHAIAQRDILDGESIEIPITSCLNELPGLCPSCESNKTVPNDEKCLRKEDLVVSSGGYFSIVAGTDFQITDFARIDKRTGKVISQKQRFTKNTIGMFLNTGKKGDKAMVGFYGTLKGDAIGLI